MPDLTTLDYVKQYLPVAARITAADEIFSSLITSCSADFLRATNRPDLLTANYTEVREGDGGTRIRLFHWPITAITALTIGGVTVTVSADKIAPGYFVDEDIDPERVYNLYLIGQAFTDGAAVKIEYAAGYAAAPEDIQQAVVDWVAFRYKQSPNLGVTQRKTTEGESMQQIQDGAPQSAKDAIERYKRCLPSVNRRYDEAEKATERKVPRR